MVGGHGEGGGEDSESGVGRTMNIFLIPVEFIVSQGNCESRDIIYDQVQTQCCQFFILIKKELMFFRKGGLSCCHAGGAFLCTIGKI